MQSRFPLVLFLNMLPQLCTNEAVNMNAECQYTSESRTRSKRAKQCNSLESRPFARICSAPVIGAAIRIPGTCKEHRTCAIWELFLGVQTLQSKGHSESLSVLRSLRTPSCFFFFGGSRNLKVCTLSKQAIFMMVRISLLQQYLFLIKGDVQRDNMSSILQTSFCSRISSNEGQCSFENCHLTLTRFFFFLNLAMKTACTKESNLEAECVGFCQWKVPAR